MCCLLEKISNKMFKHIIISSFKKNLKSTFQKNSFIQSIFSFFIKIIQSEFFINTRLSLTYDNMRLQDGIGAQLQRIISLKAISEQLGCGFCKFKIINFDETVFLNFTSEHSALKILALFLSLYLVFWNIDLFSGNKVKNRILQYIHISLNENPP